jgi:transcriptional regulator GlxA family with amidase domain
MEDGRISHIKKNVARALGQPWSVEEMAALVGLTAPSVHRLFKHNLGTTPIGYLNSLRLEKARALLSDPTSFLRIKEIGVLVGLTNESHFTHRYRATYGITPTQERRRAWQIDQAPPPAIKE